ncbi:MAG TPA: hypothetical protein VIL20_21395 [Sandaracinaceae bacterium]
MMQRRQAWLFGLLVLTGCTEGAVPPGGDAPGPVFVNGDAGTSCAHPEQGCACDPGQPPIDCYLEPALGHDGHIVCSRGTRYCRDGVWTGCESVESYRFRGGPGVAALVTGPTECNPCDPACAVHRDVPTSSDLPGRSTGVRYDPGLGGIGLIPSMMGMGPLPDSDGDGVPDVADECPGPGAVRRPDGTCDAGDAYFFHQLPYGGPVEIDPLDVSVQVRTADVYFLMDTTGSMGGEIANLRTSLTSGTFIPGCSGGIIGAIRCTIPDAWFGVGYFDDYPISPYGATGDRVYRNLQDITASVSAAQTAVNSLALHWGNDEPESQTQALWAIATGGGLGSYLAPRTGCPAGRWGYPCFRDGTIPIVILFTDAPFHNGPSGYNYSSSIGAVTWAQTVAALTSKAIRVITVHSGGTSGLADARALADATSSYSSTGSRYVFSISSDGGGLSTAVVDAVVDLANYNRMDISARAVDNPATPIDERGFVESITAVSWGPGSCSGISGSTFVQCLPGTSVDFRVAFRNDFVMPTSVPQVFTFWVEVFGDGAFVLERVPVRIVVPANVPIYPPSGSYWQDYDSDDHCTNTERPDWNTLSWEVADLPAGTSIRWELRASETAAGLASATPVTFTTPPAASPQDIGARLVAAGQNNYQRFLRVTAVLLANADRTQTPTLRSFEVRYTCVPQE